MLIVTIKIKYKTYKMIDQDKQNESNILTSTIHVRVGTELNIFTY